MPTAEAQAQRREKRHAEVDYKLHRLRLQVLFLFSAGVLLALAFAFYAQANANRIEYTRYDSCVTRTAEIMKYNALIHPPGFIPAFPMPNCGQDPRTD